ncbi:mitochondrial ribosomal small subunit component [Vermiconidia calcicola]|uniref:Mitochondrial ribosomal small subunit component n=1 Tax=Vermiconidia calcicola TaxID=1690605 RepID=A0ACC3NCC6_9PEZI|nr:mitochondrial ribosomal small subunit component [Vermiconidia calcicola]
MGRLSHAAQRVHTHATRLLQNTTHTYPPPWLPTIQTTPPAQKLVRPALRRVQKPGKKTSRIFQPVNLGYEEDKLRWEYFNDHPWELARPRVVLEGDGRDVERWDWGVELDVSLNRPRGGGGRDEFGRTVEEWEEVMRRQAARPLNGEAVIQRQKYLLHNTPLTPAAAYDKSRKELYRLRHFREISVRVAREEAESTGAFFGMGPLEVGMQLEDRAYENWRLWAEKEVAALKQLQGSAYTGTGAEDEGDTVPEVEGGREEVQEVSQAIPATRRGQEAKGGAGVRV